MFPAVFYFWAKKSHMESTKFYVGWGTLSLINAGLAQSKGRSGLNWFLLSLLLGPIATFLLVTLSSEPPEQNP
jgi:hypothetical protein